MQATAIRSLDLTMGPVYVDTDVMQIVSAQRSANCLRGLRSVEKDRDSALRTGARVAIVGYGPSLADTWQEIESGGFDAVWTVSKAHDFLRERNVTPTHHTDTDYREHKAKFNERWSRDTDYFMASQIHPSYLDKLQLYPVSLFHIDHESGGLFNPRYLKQPVMFDAGLQAARLAFALGYRDQEWFGMDASVRDGATHAGAHGGIEHDLVELVIAGVPRVTSTLLIRQAFWAEKMLCKWPHMKVKIHGDGALRPFLQERRKCSVS